jgi:hypothetical protein
MTGLAIAFALLAAVCSAVGAQLQHTGVRAETEQRALRLSGLGRLARNRSWVTGFAVLAACAVLQVLALALAPVSVVAPMVVLALPIVAVLNSRAGQFRLDAVAWLAIGATALAVGVFVAVTAGSGTEVRLPPDAMVLAVQLVAVGVGLLFVAGLAMHGMPRCIAFAVAAGAAYGLVSVLVRDVAYTVRVGGIDEVPLLSSLGVALAFLAGSWLVQLGYADGPPDVVVGCQTMANPVVASAIGIGLLDETEGLSPAVTTVLLLCGVTAVTGIAVLARHRIDITAPTGPAGHPNSADRTGRTA